MSRKKTKEEFIEESKALYGEDALDYSLVEYKGNKVKVALICKKHGTIFWIKPNSHLSSKQFGCPDCKKEALSLYWKKPFSKFIEDVEAIYGKGRFDFSEAVYINEKTKLCLISHRINPSTGKEYGKYFITPDYLLHGKYPFNEDRGNSYGESLVSLCLDELGFIYETQYKISGLGVDGKVVFIDFSLEYNNTKFWIEYNGEQHYNFVRFFHDSKKEFQRQKQRDDNVKRYCEENNIVLIEIPYTYKTLDEIESLLQRIIIDGEFDYKIEIPSRQ